MGVSHFVPFYVYPTCQLGGLSFDFDMVTSGSLSSSQGSTIVVRPHLDSQPTRCCTRCHKDFPATSAYFKQFKTGGLAVMCVDCTARKSAAKRAKEQCTQRAVSGETHGRKRRVLGDTDPNVQRKAPRLAPNEPTRWDMASQKRQLTNLP